MSLNHKAMTRRRPLGSTLLMNHDKCTHSSHITLAPEMLLHLLFVLLPTFETPWQCVSYSSPSYRPRCLLRQLLMRSVILQPPHSPPLSGGRRIQCAFDNQPCFLHSFIRARWRAPRASNKDVKENLPTRSSSGGPRAAKSLAVRAVTSFLVARSRTTSR